MNGKAEPDTANRPFTSRLPAALTLAVIGYYFMFLGQHAINVPFADDIFDVLQVISALVSPDADDSALQTLYAQHNDHRTMTSRLVYLGSYLLAGETDFRVLTLLANLALPLILLFFFLVSRGHPARHLVILPAALIIFQLRGYGILLWSMAAFAYFYVLMYGFYSLYFLHNVAPWKFALAALLACLATFTLASGQLTWLVGLASLAHQVLWRKSASFWYLLCWCAVAAICWQLWRFGLATPNTPLAMLERVIAEPGYYLLYALTLLGNTVSEQSVALAALAGIAMLVTFLALATRAPGHGDLRLELCCCYVILTVFAMTMGRAPYSTIEYALSSRYSAPSTILLAALWVLCAVRLRIRHPGVLATGFILASLYCVTSWQIYARPLQQHMEKRVDNFNRSRYWSWPRPMKETNAIVARAIDLDIYRPPPRPLAQPDIVSR